MIRHPEEPIARALAWGFLASPQWNRASLAWTGAEVLGRRYEWLPHVVSSVLAAYRRPPLDRPDELTRFLLASTDLAELVHGPDTQQHPVRVKTVITVPGQMGRRRWPVPEIDDLSALATVLELPLEQLSWVADVQGRQRRTAPGPLHLYRYHWLGRPNAVPRLLEAPTPLLRAVQRRLAEEILLWVPIHPAAHGFVRGRSALTGAAQHVGADTVVCLDLRTFFAQVTSSRVDGLFRSMGYPEAVASTLTGLCTHRTPVHVLDQLPAGGDSTSRHRLRSALRASHLPQGAPTSPALANLACYTLDVRLAGCAAAAGLTYTRYADDLAFSGSDPAVPRLVEAVTKIAREEGFAINPTKTRERRSGQRHEVTGVVTNETLGVPRAYHDQLRAVLHDAARNGPKVANRQQRPDFRAHLDGRVGWVESVNPFRRKRLRAQFDLISWPDGPSREGSPTGL